MRCVTSLFGTRERLCLGDCRSWPNSPSGDDQIRSGSTTAGFFTFALEFCGRFASPYARCSEGNTRSRSCIHRHWLPARPFFAELGGLMMFCPRMDLAEPDQTFRKFVCGFAIQHPHCAHVIVRAVQLGLLVAWSRHHHWLPVRRDPDPPPDPLRTHQILPATPLAFFALNTTASGSG